MKYLYKTGFILLIIISLSACGDNAAPKKEPQDVPPDTSKVQSAYICPCGHCGFEGSADPGTCPKCGMELQASK